MELTEFYHIDAIVPIPWHNRLKAQKIPATGTLGAIDILYPTYYYTPGIFRSLYGYYYLYSIINHVKKSANQTRYDFIFSSWLYPDAWAASRIARMLKIPLYVKPLGTDVNKLQPNDFLTTKSLEITGYANKIICVSKSMKEKLINLGCNSEKLVVLQSGIDHTIFFPRNKNTSRNELGLKPSDKIILFVGNLKKEKGLDELIQAFAELSHKDKGKISKLIIIGKGQHEAALRRNVELYNIIGFVMLLGELPLNKIALYMNACDILCLPSYMEGMPNVVIEALSCHTKIVATHVDGIPELDCGNGSMRLVPPKSISELAEALTEMLEKEVDWTRQNPIISWKDHAGCLNRIFNEL